MRYTMILVSCLLPCCLMAQAAKAKQAPPPAVAPTTNQVQKAATPAPPTPSPAPPKPKFTKQQVAHRLRELKELYDEGLLTKSFYERKVQECEVVEE